MKIRNRFVIRCFARCLAFALRALFATIRLNIRSAVPGVNALNKELKERFLYCTWHDGIIGIIFSNRPANMAGLASAHADGSWVADAMEVLNIHPIRGSSGRRGAAAIREMMTAAKDYHICITPDGPRGPRRTMKDGIVYLASQTGRKIIPVAVAARRAWRPRAGWTDMLLPKPFTEVYIWGGVPISVPPNLSREELADYRDRVQEVMDDLHDSVEGIASGESTRLPQGYSEEVVYTGKEPVATPSQSRAA